MSSSILIFDGDCNFCRVCVHWLLKRDPKGRLRYASLESEAGRRLLRDHGANPENLDSVVLIEGGAVYLRSEAVLRAIQKCQSPWKLVGVSRLVPRFIRDWGYERVSKNRSSISRAVGTLHQRWEPPEEYADRFLST